MEKHFKITADSEHFSKFRPELRQLLETASLDQKKIDQVLLSVQEALTNILRHSYHGQAKEISLIFTEDPDKVTITLEDCGEKFDLTKKADPKIPREEPGGLGIFFIKQSMDKVIYDESCKNGNRIHLIKYKHTQNDHPTNSQKVTS